MMKLNIIAFAIPALLAANAANAVEIYNKNGNKLEIYGKVAGVKYFQDQSGENDKTSVNFGFKSESKIKDQLLGYGQWDYSIQANNSESSNASSNKTHLGFAGLKFGKMGSIDYGRNYGVVYDAISWTDVLPAFGGDSSYSDNFMNGRSTGLLTYRNKNFFGLMDGWDFAMQYQGTNNREDIRCANGKGWGLSTAYTSPIGWGIVGAYSNSNRTTSQNATALQTKENIIGVSQEAENWAAAIKYDAHNIYLAAMYGENHNSTPITVATEKSSTSTAFAKRV